MRRSRSKARTRSRSPPRYLKAKGFIGEVSAAPVAALALRQDSRAAGPRSQPRAAGAGRWRRSWPALALAFLSQSRRTAWSTGIGIPLRDVVVGRRGVAAAACRAAAGRWRLRAARVGRTPAWRFAAALLLAGLAVAGRARSARRCRTRVAAWPHCPSGGGFWVLVLLAWLAAADAVQRLRLRPWPGAFSRTPRCAAAARPAAVGAPGRAVAAQGIRQPPGRVPRRGLRATCRSSSPRWCPRC